MSGNMRAMPAYRLPGWGRALELAEVAVPTPQGRELLVEVQAVGLCHSDLFVMGCDEGVLPYDLPLTLGHEVAGRVVAGGDESDQSLVGRSGVVHGVWSCGDCHNCRSGRDNYCVALEGKVGCGLGRDGGLAHYVLLPDARHFVVADTVSPIVLAPLADAGLTSYHAIRSLGDALLGDSTVLLIGVGGLGHLAVQILRATTSAQVIAVDPRPEARTLASELGAQQTAATIDEALALGSGVDIVLDFVGSDETMRQGAARASCPVAGWWSSAVPAEAWSSARDWRCRSAGRSAHRSGGRAPTSSPSWSSPRRACSSRWSRWCRSTRCRRPTQRLHDGGVTGRLVVVDGRRAGMNRTARELRVRRYPAGHVTADDFEVVEVDVPAPGPGQVLVRNTWTSVDPGLRLRLRPDAPAGYFVAFPLGQAMDGIMAVGEVVESRAEGFCRGDIVSHAQGWREYAVVNPRRRTARRGRHADPARCHRHRAAVAPRPARWHGPDGVRRPARHRRAARAERRSGSPPPQARSAAWPCRSRSSAATG